ncbi:IclR family transcriptional regulator C-terminal domain-containing protein [Saccharopolyspora sp. NPDC050389]|uniref:IclR family transcriptional regulator domain-containing protein n=1 Tax=Saccharopolyspora sp. NPDC050389 TaxID=3155516 RepID=UPI0033F2407A
MCGPRGTFSRRRPLLTTAAGKAMPAFLEEDEPNELLVAHPDQNEVQSFLAEIGTIREAGVVNVRSPFGDTSAVGCPVRDRAGHVVAAVVLAGDPDGILKRRGELSTLLENATGRWATES